MFIEREAAAEYRERTKPKTDAAEVGGKSDPGQLPPNAGGRPDVTPGSQVTGGPTKRHFYGTIKLDPVRATIDFATVVDEVVQQFTSKLGVDVTISVEIQATSRDGFEENLQRTVKENCNTLKFTNADFEDGTD